MQLGPSRAVIPFKEARALTLARAAGVNPQSGFGRGDRVYGIPGKPRGVRVAGMGAYISGDGYGDGRLHSRYGPVGSGGYGPLKGLSGLSAHGYGSGVPTQKYGPLRLGNMSAALSDYINTPGTPGSSNFFLYGLGQDESDWWSSSSPSDVAMDNPVTPSSSPSFWDSLSKIATTAVQAAPAVLQVVNQQNAVSALNAGKITPAQYQMLMQQPTATIALQPSAGLATGLKIGGGTIAALGIGALALILLKKKR